MQDITLAACVAILQRGLGRRFPTPGGPRRRVPALGPLAFGPFADTVRAEIEARIAGEADGSGRTPGGPDPRR